MAIDKELKAQFDRLHNDNLYLTALAVHKLNIATIHARAHGIAVPPEPVMVKQAREVLTTAESTIHKGKRE